MSKWISVEERLPEEHQKVDVLIDWDLRYTDAEYYDNNFYGLEQDFDVDDCGYGCFKNTDLMHDITHWMPLPEPPK